MGLRDELTKMNPGIGGGTCNTCDAMAEMSDEDRAALEEALMSRAFTGTMIAQALENTGFAVTVGSVRRHRRGECAAGKRT